MQAGYLRHIAAIVAAGIAGTLANAAAAALLIDGTLIRLALVPGRYAIAILVASVLPFILARTGVRPAAAIGFVILAVAPSLLAKLVFGAGAPWPTVLGLNAVYAIAAVAVYLSLARTRPL